MLFPIRCTTTLSPAIASVYYINVHECVNPFPIQFLHKTADSFWLSIIQFIGYD